MTPFHDDVAFLRKHTDVIVLSDATGSAQVAVTPALQARVMTSTADQAGSRSFGWINRELIASRQVAPHINAFGGEDRIWLGPEGGQFSIYFAKGAPFDLEHWFVPAPLDTQPFRTLRHSQGSAEFQSDFTLTNYSGTKFHVTLKREVRLLTIRAPTEKLAFIGYESRNTLRNAGKEPWKKSSGLLSLWIAGMFPAAPATTIVVPIRRGSPSELGHGVTADYFGAVPPERLQVSEEAVFLRGDGRFRSKIGVTPRRSLRKLGSYDADAGVLTIVQFDQPRGVTDYVNSLWKLQDDPYGGDALNSYNDGPPAPGAKSLGAFYELESSSPAAALAPGASLDHTHRTLHLAGAEDDLDGVAQAVLGTSLKEIKGAFDAD